MRSGLRLRDTYMFLIIGACILMLIFFWNKKIETEHVVPLRIIVEHGDAQGGKAGNSVNFDLGKCSVPKLDINNKEVKHFFEHVQPLSCQLETEESQKNWVYLENDTIRFHEYRKDSTCTATYFHMKTDEENAFDDPVYIQDGDKMKSDVAIINCGWNFLSFLGLGWEGILYTVVKNEKAYEQAKLKEKKEEEEERLNVFFLGFDSLSQMTFRRKLPKTVEVIEKLLEGVIMNGYNIVGDGTPQAYIPILTGQTEVELPLTRKRFGNARFVDDVYPFIWNNFSDAGYVTNYGEDLFQYATFNYRLKGFRKQPTDHYPRYFFKEVEKNCERNCVGSLPMHKMWFEYTKRFVEVYRDVPTFSMMHQSRLSHDNLNLVEVEDNDLADFLTDMYTKGLFNNSLVILMADHGHRFSQMREKHQGQLEEKLPFVSITLPKWFRKTPRGMKMQKNLLDNRDRLATPFDMYSTFWDILKPPTMEELDTVQDNKRRSLSYFRPLPLNRTCDQADIPAHFCTCLNWITVTGAEMKLVKSIAKEIVSAFNDETAPERRLCSEIHLAEIIYAKKFSNNAQFMAFKMSQDLDGMDPLLGAEIQAESTLYQIKLRTQPGNAIYEVTTLYETEKNTIKLDLKSVSHVNQYGDTPHCIIDKNYFLATYCVCYDMIK